MSRKITGSIPLPVGLLISLLLSPLLTACFDENSVAPRTSTDPGELIGRYTISGDSLIWMDSVYATQGCRDTGMVSGFVKLDYRNYRVQGDSLFLFLRRNTYLTDYWAFVRMGNGSGLHGVWNMTGYVATGEYADDENHETRNSTVVPNQRLASFSDQKLEFRNGGLYQTLDIRQADRFLDNWARNFQSEYAIEATALDKYSVELQGEKNGETVTITMTGDDESVTYASSDPGHASYTVYKFHPQACPQPSGWYSGFEDANQESQ